MNALETAFPNNSSSRANSVFHRPLRARLQNQVITLENAERGITLHVGERFMLDLGRGTWHIRLGNASIVKCVDVQDTTNGQGTFEALFVGKTKIYATHLPPRMNGSPPRSRIFLEIQVHVQG